MAVAYYLAPWISMYAVGQGRFSLTNPGGGRPVKASRCLLYGQWNLTPNSSVTIGGARGDGTGRPICLTRVDQANTTHNLISADPAIRRLPFPNTSAQLQSAVSNDLEAFGFDSSWIQPATPAREIMRYLLRVIIGIKEMGADYPAGNLANRWDTLSGSQRNRVVSYLRKWHVPTNDLANDTPLRTVVTKIGRVNRGTIFLGPDIF